MSNQATVSRPRLTQSQRQKIKRLRKEGLTNQAIADVVGCGVATVYRVLHNKNRVKAKPVAKQVASQVTEKVVKPAPNGGTKTYVKTVKTEFSFFWGLVKVTQTR